MDCVLDGVFTVPGDGLIDYDPIMAALYDTGYEGWVIIEAEQDPAKANPLVYAKMGHEALCSALGKAGYQVDERTGWMADLLCLGEPMLEFNQQPDGRWLENFGGDTSNCAISAARRGRICGLPDSFGGRPVWSENSGSLDKRGG